MPRSPLAEPEQLRELPPSLAESRADRRVEWYAPPELVDELNRVAKLRRWSRSLTIRVACERLVEQEAGTDAA